ncbi:MAG: cytochrome D1 domain-containing protein [Terracidiphilus sp.]|jgi:YVTN family beta-propeller protein
MNLSRLAVSLVLFSLTVSAGFAQQDRLLVTQKGTRSLAIVDPVAGTVIASVQEGGITGHEVVASADGRLAYVPIYGSSGVGMPGTDGQNLVVIDIAAQKVMGSVDFGRGVRPHMPLLGPKDHLLYVTTELDNAVTLIDPKTLRIVGTIPTGAAQSHMLALSHDGLRGYTSNVVPGSVSVLDIAARKTIAVIPVSPNAQRISISNDDHWVFTSDETKPRLAVIDTTTNKLKSWIPLEGTGYGSAPTPDGRWLLLAIPGKDNVAVIDLDTMQVARSVAVGKSPQEILVRPDGKVAYVSCIGSDQVAEIDLASWKVTRFIATGKGTDGLAWAAAH